jgi:hypothetical protein
VLILLIENGLRGSPKAEIALRKQYTFRYSRSCVGGGREKYSRRSNFKKKINLSDTYVKSVLSAVDSLNNLSLSLCMVCTRTRRQTLDRYRPGIESAFCTD